MNLCKYDHQCKPEIIERLDPSCVGLFRIAHLQSYYRRSNPGLMLLGDQVVDTIQRVLVRSGD